MKTVKVRIALEINLDGQWHAYGHGFGTDDDCDWDEIMDGLSPLEGYCARHWIEAEIPVPDAAPAVLVGKAVEVEPA